MTRPIAASRQTMHRNDGVTGILADGATDILADGTKDIKDTLAKDTLDAPPEGEGMSTLLAAFRDALPAGRVSLADIIAALGDRSFGSFMLVLAIPTVMPVPLGVSVLFDIPILVFSAQMMLGQRTLRLPRWLMTRSVDRINAARLLNGVLPTVRWIERLLRPRLPALTAGNGERWLGVVCFLLAMTAIVPLPLTGWLPGFGLVVIALGLVERDGVAVLVGLGLGVAAMVALFAVVTSLSYAGNLLFSSAAPVY